MLQISRVGSYRWGDGEGLGFGGDERRERNLLQAAAGKNGRWCALGCEGNRWDEMVISDSHVMTMSPETSLQHLGNLIG